MMQQSEGTQPKSGTPRSVHNDIHKICRRRYIKQLWCTV